MEQSVYFRAGAGVIIYNQHNEVLMFKRVGKDESELAWQFPQGGLDAGESAESAVWRELFEETAIAQEELHNISELPNWIGYEYDQETLQKLESHGITNTGQVQRWSFAQANDDLVVDLTQAQDKEFDGHKWVPIDNCLEQIVMFKREMFETLIDYLKREILQ